MNSSNERTPNAPQTNSGSDSPASVLVKDLLYELSAMDILDELSGNLNTGYGAEAAYLLIVDSYDRGEFVDVENKVYAFADSGSEQTYWLAKSFVILCDSFVERGELKQARATFESVKEGYSSESADDDVLSSIELRLTKLEEIEKDGYRDFHDRIIELLELTNNVTKQFFVKFFSDLNETENI
jgi:hypothetical protein